MSLLADPEQRVRDLARAIVAIGSETSLEDVLQQTVDTAARLVGARWAALGVLDRTGSHLERFITTGIDDETRARIGGPPGGHGVLRVLLHDGRPLRLADVTQDAHFKGFPPGHPPMRSFLGVPIFVRDVVYGDLYLAEKEGGQFTAADEEIVTLLAAQTAITIERVRIHEAVVHWVRQLEALNELTLGVLEERDVSRLLDLVARRLRELIGARRVLISVPAPSGGLRVVAADGDGVANLVGYGVPPESKGARVLARGKSERIDSLLEDPEVDQVSARRAGGLDGTPRSLLSFTRRPSASFPPSTRTVPIPASPTMTFASRRRSALAPRSRFISQNAWRVKRSKRFSMPKRPSAAGSRGSCTTRRAPR